MGVVDHDLTPVYFFYMVLRYRELHILLSLLNKIDMHFLLLIVTFKCKYLNMYAGHISLHGKRPFPEAGEEHEIASN